MIDLSGRIALVTGASRGIGAASARALDRAGARVVLSGRTISDLQQVASELRHDPVVAPADLSSRGSGTALARDVLELTGGIDILVNNAGIPMRRTPDTLTEDDVDQVFAVNVRSLLMLTVGLAPSMIDRGVGSVINISSIAGLRGSLGRIAYAGTKGAVDALTRALAADWGPRGLRVNAIAPGIIDTAIWAASKETVPGLVEDITDQIALRRWGTSEDVADVVLFLASDLSRYITAETIIVDGGLVKVNVIEPGRRPS
jgi:NAD(P)-dependent dehydrogenase (short-subunit alcohol dehydrogenase family)